MNKRLEEKLAMLAFGDMSPEETALLEKELAGDRQAMLALEDYRGMRSGLKAMAVSVPDHQLSSERLRHAILTQGLQPKPVRPAFGWLWAPVGAAALVFGLVMVRNMQRADPIVNLGPEGSIVTFGGNVAGPTFDTGMFTLPSPKERFSSLLEAPTKAASQPKAIFASNEPRRARVHRSQGDERLIALRDEIEEQFDSEIGSMPSARTAGGSPSGPSGAPIILIDGNSTDSATGAPRATEVDSASNVLVGG